MVSAWVFSRKCIVVHNPNLGASSDIYLTRGVIPRTPTDIHPCDPMGVIHEPFGLSLGLTTDSGRDVTIPTTSLRLLLIVTNLRLAASECPFENMINGEGFSLSSPCQ